GAAIGAARPVVTPRRDPRSTAGIRRLLAVAMSIPALAALGVAGSVAVCCGTLGLAAYHARPLEVAATVRGRTWVREVQVERLGMAPSATWEDRLPPAAGLPGTSALSEGRGAILGCEVRKCWPRPPGGATLARVTGRSWSHRITTRRLVRRTDEGWEGSVPAASGAFPVDGTGGSEGRLGPADCRTREREPERCHTETHRVPDGSHEVCTRRDLHNGFAEEDCRDVQDFRTESERVCTPAVRDEWCSWTTLTWANGRTVEQTGGLEPPTWPALDPASDERVTRSATYAVAVRTLAGPEIASFHPDDAAALVRWAPGALLFVQGDAAAPVPVELTPPDRDRVDCGDGIPPNVLTTRRWCRYEQWSWNAEPALRTSATDGAPPWPDGALGDDGRETRSEWATLDLDWSRGDHHGARQVKVDAARWDGWPIGATIPVVVDANAGFRSFPRGDPR
ncbi:MAG: hypothetical protein ABMB14_38895, partial [Myxococcota bacterium]